MVSSMIVAGVLAFLVSPASTSPLLRPTSTHRVLPAEAGTVPALLPPGFAFASVNFGFIGEGKGSTFRVTYTGEGKLQAIGYPREAMNYLDANTPGCFLYDYQLFRSRMIGSVLATGLLNKCTFKPIYNGTITSGVPAVAHKDVVWILVNHNQGIMNVTGWRIMPVPHYRMPAYGVVLLLFTIFLVAVGASEVFRRRMAKNSKDTDVGGAESADVAAAGASTASAAADNGADEMVATIGGVEAVAGGGVAAVATGGDSSSTGGVEAAANKASTHLQLPQ